MSRESAIRYDRVLQLLEDHGGRGSELWDHPWQEWREKLIPDIGKRQFLDACVILDEEHGFIKVRKGAFKRGSFLHL